MYHKVKNKGGVVRDHRISIDYGFKNKISPDIIKHPANCRFVPVYANSGKSTKCEISLQQLVEEISIWNNATLAQLVERLPEEQGVGGSIPSGSTKL